MTLHVQVGYADGATTGLGWGLAVGLDNRLAAVPTRLSADTPVSAPL